MPDEKPKPVVTRRYGFTHGNQYYRYEEKFGEEEYRGKLCLENLTIGEVRLRQAEKFECPDTHYMWYVLEDLFIGPSHRKNGLGDLMYQKLLDHVKSKEYAVLYHHKDPMSIAKEKLVGFLLNRGKDKQGKDRCFKFHDIDSNGNLRFYYTYDGEDVGWREEIK